MSKNKKQLPAVELVSVPIIEYSRKLKATWTVETHKELEVVFGTKELADQLRKEIDKQIIRDLRKMDPLRDLKNLIRKAKRVYKDV